MNLPIVGRADRVAEQNRARLDLNGVFAINLVAPAGAGKASLVQRTVQALSARASILRLKVGGTSQLKAAELGRALDDIRLRGVDLLLVENASDFVCPGTCKVGAHANVRVTTVFDEPPASLHEPCRYQGLDALVVNKVDRASEAGFDTARFLRRLGGSSPNLMVFFTSCVEERGLQPWIGWIVRCRNAHFHRPGRAALPRAREETFA